MLPLSIIMGPLTVLRVLADIFEAMMSLGGGQTLTDPTLLVLNFLGSLAILAFVPLVIAYSTIASRFKAEGQRRPS